MATNAVQTTNNQVAQIKEKTITDKVLNSVNLMTHEQGLVLPKNYNASNALKAAYLKLAEGNLLNTDQTSLAQALLNMCIQGLNPAKNQCYFINYGGKVNMIRSYFGDRAACIASGIVKDIQGYIIYEGDEVNVNYIDGYLNVEHKTSFENMCNEIKGAYAMAVLPDGSKRFDIMPYARIKASWGMSKNQSNNKLQNTFSDDACKRTVIRHLVKNLFNQSIDDNAIVDSYCETTNKEYEIENASANTDYAAANQTEVKQKQEAINASVEFKPTVEEEPIPEPAQMEMDFNTDDEPNF